MNSLVLIILCFLFMDYAYGLMLMQHKTEYFDKVSKGKKTILRVDGLVAILTLFLLIMEISCIVDLIVAMRGR